MLKRLDRSFVGLPFRANFYNFRFLSQFYFWVCGDFLWIVLKYFNDRWMLQLIPCAWTAWFASRMQRASFFILLKDKYRMNHCMFYKSWIIRRPFQRVFLEGIWGLKYNPKLNSAFVWSDFSFFLKSEILSATKFKIEKNQKFNQKDLLWAHAWPKNWLWLTHAILKLRGKALSELQSFFRPNSIFNLSYYDLNNLI